MLQRSEEIWKPIPGYEGWYDVSDHGHVRRMKPGKGTHVGRLMKEGCDSFGRSAARLTKDGKSRSFLVPRLVLMAFVGPCPDGMECCHADDDNKNNHLSNLRWDTRSANQYDRVRNGRNPQATWTHCIHGHEFTEKNTYIKPNGTRSCKTCKRATKKRLEWKKQQLQNQTGADV